MAKIHTSEKATIPEKHYVAMQKRGDGLPLAFMTPYGDDAAAKKRMSVVDSWAGGKNKDNSITIENTPMYGFKLPGDIRTPGRYGGGDKWRIEDPRGFELEISSSNLAELLSLNTFEKGEILEQCVWGRDKGNNILVSVESDVYKDAVAFTEITTSSASWKDIKLGYKIILQNGFKGTYLGKYHYLSNNNWGFQTDSQLNAITAGTKSFHIIYVPTTDRKYPVGVEYELHFLASPKLSKIINDIELSPSEAELKVNEYIMNKKCCVVKSGYGNEPIMLSTAPIKSWKLSLESNIDFDFSSIKEGYNRYGMFRLPDGKLVNVSTSNRKEINLLFVIEDLLKDGIYKISGSLKTQQHYYSSFRHHTNWQADNKTMTIPSFVQEVKNKLDLKLTIETKLGNTITTILN